eukprot:scaffold33213_cov60-Phaeocystis_antarctica.AAC.10
MRSISIASSSASNSNWLSATSSPGTAAGVAAAASVSSVGRTHCGWLRGGGGGGGRPRPLGLFGHGVEVVSPAVWGLGLVPLCGQRRPAMAPPRTVWLRSLRAVIICLSEAGRCRGLAGRRGRGTRWQRGGWRA